MSRKTKSQKKQADRRRLETLHNATVSPTSKQTATPENAGIPNIITSAPKIKAETKVEKASMYEESSYDLATKKATWKDLMRTCVIIAALLGIQSYVFFIK